MVSCLLCKHTIRHDSEQDSVYHSDMVILKKLRLTVPVRCCMTGKGCDWQGEITQFWEHVSVCEAFPRPCPFECDPKVFMPKQFLNDHLKDKCPMKPVACEYQWAGCTEVCARRDMPRHMQDSAVPHNQLLNKATKEYHQVILKLSAENYHLKNGGECDPKVFMPKQVINDHLRDECPMKPVACEYQWAGCTEVCAHREMPRHMQDSAVLHNQLLIKATKGYRQVISKLNAEIDNLKNGGEVSETRTNSSMPNARKFTCKNIIIIHNISNRPGCYGQQNSCSFAE